MRKIVITENGYTYTYEEVTNLSDKKITKIMESLNKHGYDVSLVTDDMVISYDIIKLKEEGYKYITCNCSSVTNNYSRWEGIDFYGDIKTLNEAINVLEEHYNVRNIVIDSWSSNTLETKFNNNCTFEGWTGNSSCYYYMIMAI